MSIGSRIKQRRTELNMSQEVLAEKIGVSRSAISNWEIERNYPDLQVIVSLSDILDIPLDILLKGDAAVVEKISTDTVQRKSLSKKLKFAYIFIAILIVLMGFALQKQSGWIYLLPIKYNLFNTMGKTSLLQRICLFTEVWVDAQ